ncbi:MAG: AMMECR1 domain-containing protein [Firmicutes bacterium HGW-Firmicutes-1]|jgi:AmmeMemoRadiSam system protein A|nr:MAG: AMMECR1 domain-containing protein [Firmicutes bacterium HGW-Firmicutes-1]
MKKYGVFFMPHPPILIHAIGNGKEQESRSTLEGMSNLAKAIQLEKPDTIIFISPHGNSFSNGTCILYSDELYGDFSDFGNRETMFHKSVNKDLAMNIFNRLEDAFITVVLMDQKTAKQYGVKVQLDHGVMVPMHFIDEHYSQYKVVHITPGFTDLEENYRIGKLIDEAISNSEEKILIVCSGDLSHALSDEGPYQYHPEGKTFDEVVRHSIENGDPLSLLSLSNHIIEEAAQCGLRSFLMGFGAMDGVHFESKVLSYEGPFGVGYLTGMLMKSEQTKESFIQVMKEQKQSQYTERTNNEDQYITLARKTIEEYVRTGKRLNLEYVKEHFTEEFFNNGISKRSGVFVSIHKGGKLRGCIGTISAVADHLIDEIIYNSISASSNDTRFDAISKEELMDLEIKVDILFEQEAIHSKKELDVKKYGVIVEKGAKRGLLLPNLEGIDDVEQQVSIAMQKAGIDHEEGMKLYRFEVERHEI